MIANLVVSIDLSQDLETQLERLQKFKSLGFTFERKVGITQAVKNGKGPYELHYLKVSGKQKMKITDGTTDREAAAKKRLEAEYPDELENVVLTEADTVESVESSDSEAVAPVTDDDDGDDEKLF